MRTSIGVTLAAAGIIAGGSAVALFGPVSEPSTREPTVETKVVLRTGTQTQRDCAPVTKRLAHAIEQVASANASGDCADRSEPSPELRESYQKAWTDMIRAPSPSGEIELIRFATQVGAGAVTDLVARMDSDSLTERIVATRVLGRIGSPAGVPRLVEAALSDEDEQVAALSSQSLALAEEKVLGEGREFVEQAFLELERKPNGSASKINAIYGLVKLRNPRGLQASQQFLLDPDITEQEKLILFTNLLQLGLPELMVIVELGLGLWGFGPEPVVQSIAKYYEAIGAMVELLQIPGRPDVAVNEFGTAAIAQAQQMTMAAQASRE